MDLLFKRYANPFPFVDGMIQTGRFSEFVRSFIEKENSEREEQTAWEFWLHKVWEGSFAEFKNDMESDKKNKQMSEQTMETTIKDSMNILKNFNPIEKGGDS